ncbi:MAG: CBS domain-containing protein [Desulfobacterales bacterium]|nr:MAG: CBS domain-containing protein [Desulfobacterales bacterium]
MQLITTHKNTDFDALASVVAAMILYPNAIPVLPKIINPNVKAFLSIHKDLFRMYSPGEIDMDGVRRLIVVDTNRWGRLDRMEGIKQRKYAEIILWDHHLNSGDIHPTWQCQEEMGANVTLMIRQLKKENKVVTPIQATLFLAGIYEDTGNLMFPSSKAEDAYAAAYLLEQGADLNVINSLLRPAYGKKQKIVLFNMLKAVDKVKIGGHHVSMCKLEIEGHIDSLAVVVGMYREILNVDAAFGIFTDKTRGRCIIIGRSNVDGVNIGSVMQGLGGGGHPGAGSAMLKSMNPDVVEEMIKALIKDDRNVSVLIKDLMSSPVFAISSDTSMKEAALLLREKGCTGVPIVDNGKLVGIISRRDFRKIKKESQLKAPIRAFMSTRVKKIGPEESPMDAARLMVKYDIGRLPVVEDDKIVGIITRSDAMNYFYKTGSSIKDLA